jgi:hypothetical protein
MRPTHQLKEKPMTVQIDNSVANVAKDVIVETAKSLALTAAGVVVGLVVFSVTTSLVQKVQLRRALKAEEDLDN